MNRVLLASAALGLAACLATADHNQLTRRAQFDMNCPSDRLTFTQIDDKTVGVRGCGQQATYVESCDGPRDKALTECTWVRNSGDPLPPPPDEPTAPAPSASY